MSQEHQGHQNQPFYPCTPKTLTALQPTSAIVGIHRVGAPGSLVRWLRHSPRCRTTPTADIRLDTTTLTPGRLLPTAHRERWTAPLTSVDVVVREEWAGESGGATERHGCSTGFAGAMSPVAASMRWLGKRQLCLACQSSTTSVRRSERRCSRWRGDTSGMAPHIPCFVCRSVL